MTFTFLPGLHQPSDAKHFPACCISINRLRTRKKPLDCPLVLVDSGSFTELKLYGRYRFTVDQYAGQLMRLHGAGIQFAAAVAQDFMCEKFMLDRTGLTVLDHQRLTIGRYDDLMAKRLPFYIMPVIQGYAPEEYHACTMAYGDRLQPGMWVGVGSVCKRNVDPESIVDVLAAIHAARPDLRLHGFGVKLTALLHSGVRAQLATADSMAWSFAARRKRHAGDKASSANDWRAAMVFSERMQALGGVPADEWQPPLPMWG